MSKTEFLEMLYERLDKIDKIERDKYITYYDEIIEDYKENGYEEAKAIEKLGCINDITKNILTEQNTVIANQSSTGIKHLKLTLLALGSPLWGCILMSVALLILSGIIIVWCVPITTGAGAIGFLLTSLVSIIGSPFIMMESLSLGIIQLGLGITSIGIGILLTIVTIVMCKKMKHITHVLTLKLNSIFKKKVVEL